MHPLREGDRILIKGQINQIGSPIIRIIVRGSKDEIAVDGILEKVKAKPTLLGFDGFICLPIAVAVPLGLELIDVADSELADGTIVQDELVFAGKVLWGSEFMDVDILLTKSADTLIGTAMLMNSDVRLNFHTGEVLIEQVV